MRTLVSTRRLVGEARLPEYDAVWAELADTAKSLPFHVNAWRFRSAADARLHVEFLEFSGEIDPREDPAVAGSLRKLDAVAPGEAEEWVDVGRTPRSRPQQEEPTDE